jgi:protein-tyrosine phosphatase
VAPYPGPVAFDLLVVCTANICRSPATARALRVNLAALGLGNDVVAVSSAGVRALPGLPMCEVSEQQIEEHLFGLAPDPLSMHASRVLTADIAAQADLILTADRTHRREVLAMAPVARARTFTVRQAARLAAWVAGPEGTLPVAQLRANGGEVDLDPLDPRVRAPALPTTTGGRMQWFVGEIDAARGLAPAPKESPMSQWDVDDIGDPHVEGSAFHPLAAQSEAAAAADLAQAIAATLRV